MYTFSRPLFLLFVKKQTQNILGEKVQPWLIYFGRGEHQDNLNTAVFLVVMIMDSKFVCRTSGSKPVLAVVVGTVMIRMIIDMISGTYNFFKN